ncbi:MAG: hypothetical protein ACTHKS_18560 [Gaiellaceae bacterium]
MILAATIAAFTCGAVAPTARADGDPASDYLLGEQVFFPPDIKFSSSQQTEFAKLVRDANQAGFKIRVALIGSSYDMGSVTSLYLKPRTYARFLGFELSFLYKKRLLVVMQNGFGFNWPHHSTAAAYRTLATIRIGPGADGLLTAAQSAVRRLAAADGVKLPAPTAATTSARNTSRDRLTIIAAAAAAILLAAGATWVLRRRRREVG